MELIITRMINATYENNYGAWEPNIIQDQGQGVEMMHPERLPCAQADMYMGVCWGWEGDKDRETGVEGWQ